MKYKNIIFILIILFFSGCGVVQTIREKPPEEKPVIHITGEIRGIFLYGFTMRMTEELEKFAEDAAEAGFNSVIFSVMNPADFSSENMERLNRIAGIFHARNLAFLLSISETGSDYVNPEKNYSFSQGIRRMTEEIEMDGFYVHPMPSELFEAMICEIMLVKPHLPVLVLKENDEMFASALASLDDDERIDAAVVQVNSDEIRIRPADRKNQTIQHKNRIILKQRFKDLKDISDMYALIESVRSQEGLGFILRADSPECAAGILKLFISAPLQKSEPFPQFLKRIHPDRVIALLTDSLDTAGSLFHIQPWGISANADSRGWIRFIIPEKADSLDLKWGASSMRLYMNHWKPPFRYRVLNDSTFGRVRPWVEFRRMPSDTTEQNNFHLLCRSVWPGSAIINGDSVKMYRTGIFFSHLHFTPGINLIRAESEESDSEEGQGRAVYERKIFYEKTETERKPFPLWLNPGEPEQNMVILPSDRVRFRFTGSRGQNGMIELSPSGRRVECKRKNFSDYSIYEAELPASVLNTGREYDVNLILEASHSGRGKDVLKEKLPFTIRVENPEDFPLVRVTEPNAVLTYNLGQIRLGGPIINEQLPGAVLQVNGIFGGHFRIALGPDETGMIAAGNVEVLPAGSLKPGYYIRSIHAEPSRKRDVVTIPYSEPVPYAVFPEPHAKQIRIRLYGVKTTSTWITHKDGLKVIERVTWDQPDTETYDLLIQLNTSDIWGYRLRPVSGALVFEIKHPPGIMEDNSMKGLKIAIEAGHGGHNHGAEGLSGLLEKDVNLDVALELEKRCLEHGMEVLQARKADQYMTLGEKRDRIEEYNPDLMVSIHANAGSGQGGYLRVGGVSTYYHNAFWSGYANTLFKKLRELPLDDFGVVGSFNYRVTRLTLCPAVLVELAFMDHAEDEEKLADPLFRKKLAEKIFEGLAEYVHKKAVNQMVK